MAGKESKHGKAFEYSVAVALANVAEADLADNQAVAICRSSYEFIPNNLQDKMRLAAQEAAKFLAHHERRHIKAANIVTIQPDKIAQKGDVRDVLLCRNGKPLFGISAKHQHRAIKHPRLSDTIDFGEKWAGCPVSKTYWNEVKAIFGTLRRKKEESQKTALFDDIENKEQTVYLPIITAFEDEMNRLIKTHGEKFCRNMFHYLVGKEDFYQVVAGKDKVRIKSFNLKGSLAWGKKWSMPTHIETVKREGTNTLRIVFERSGWQISFRLHNATSRVEPSLKFDINFTGIADDAEAYAVPFPTS